MKLIACRWICLSSLGAAVVSTACFEPTNPCDPAADPEVQGQGTRLAGVVVDQHGAPLAGVPITVASRGATQVSGLSGEFAFEGLPPADDYELVALPTAPLVGGRAHTGPLACRSTLDELQVVVLVPPDSPEIELARATGERRLFVAFGAIGDEDPGDLSGFFDDGEVARDAATVTAQCAEQAHSATLRYRVQVRSPFDEWRDARLSAFPWVDPMSLALAAEGGAVAARDLSLVGVDDLCAAALCTRFAYLEDSLHDPRARCAEVIGVVTGQDEEGGDIVEPLEAYGSYQVRVRSELRTDDTQRSTYALPERILAAAPTLPAQMSLLPGSLLPVVDGNGNPRTVGEVRAIQPTAGGRFALLEGSSLALIGDGADVLDENAESNVGSWDAAQNAMGVDAAAEASMTNDFMGDASPTAVVHPLAVLPSGSWLRVIRWTDDELSAPTTSIEKVYVGSDATTARDGPDAVGEAANAVEPAMSIDPAAEQAGSALRAFSYLTPFEGSLVEQGVNPPDAYVLLYRTAFVMMEQGNVDDMSLGWFATGAGMDDATGDIGVGWAADADAEDDVGAFKGTCSDLANVGDPNLVEDMGVLGRGRVSICYDVAAALDEPVDLRDLKLMANDGAPVHVMADAQNDRVLLASTAALTCAGCDAGAVLPLSTQMGSLSVGREPVALARSRSLDCSGNGTTREVMLVANHGSGDLSVLAQDAGELREVAVIPLPASPAGFLDDPLGPSCSDPFVWVLADDGQLIPVDMRGEPGVPLCGEGDCALGTRGRGTVGGVQRQNDGVTGPGRALVGGPGLLGELGFFRPNALRGAAYADPTELMGEEVAPAP